MKNQQLVFAALLVLGLSGGSMAQNKSSHPQATQGSATTIPLASGTAINASLIGSIDSERSKPGDPVTAVVTEAVVYQRCVLLPKGSKIIGHVVRTGADNDASSALFVEFDRAILKDGQEATLNAGIQALAPATAPPTIPSREKYEENRLAGAQSKSGATLNAQDPLVLPSNYALPRRSKELPVQRIEGGLDRKGMFTPDSKGAFAEPGMKLFTPMSEGSHGTVLVGSNRNIHLDHGTRLLIVVQPPAGQ